MRIFTPVIGIASSVRPAARAVDVKARQARTINPIAAIFRVIGFTVSYEARRSLAPRARRARARAPLARRRRAPALRLSVPREPAPLWRLPWGLRAAIRPCDA